MSSEREITCQLVDDMVSRGIVEKLVESGDRNNDEYWLLASPDALEKEAIVVVAIGYPEIAGVWSYTLLRQERIPETSMEAYFQTLAANGIGMVVINPNCTEPDMEGSSFVCQLEKLFERIPASARVALIGFSMGGGMILRFLDGNPGTIEDICGLVLLDPALPGKLKLGKVRDLLNDRTLLIASEGEDRSPGKIAAMLLGIPAQGIDGIHGEMPAKSHNIIMKFLGDRLGHPITT